MVAGYYNGYGNIYHNMSASADAPMPTCFTMPYHYKGSVGTRQGVFGEKLNDFIYANYQAPNLIKYFTFAQGRKLCGIPQKCSTI